MLVPVIQHGDFFYTFQDDYWISLVMMCHHKDISHWLYSPHCTFQTGDIYFATESWYLLIPLTYFFLPPTPLSSGIYNSVSVLLCWFICFDF